MGLEVLVPRVGGRLVVVAIVLGGVDVEDAAFRLQLEDLRHRRDVWVAYHVVKLFVNYKGPRFRGPL